MRFGIGIDATSYVSNYDNILYLMLLQQHIACIILAKSIYNYL